jgi:hypothetical protein
MGGVLGIAVQCLGVCCRGDGTTSSGVTDIPGSSVKEHWMLPRLLSADVDATSCLSTRHRSVAGESCLPPITTRGVGCCTHTHTHTLSLLPPSILPPRLCPLSRLIGLHMLTTASPLPFTQFGGWRWQRVHCPRRCRNHGTHRSARLLREHCQC